MTLTGTYSDTLGTEPVTWTIASSEREGWKGRFEVSGVVRGVRVSGTHFGSLEVEEPSHTVVVNSAGELTRCVITVEVPAVVDGDASESSCLILEFRLGADAREPVVRATLTADGTGYSHEQEEILESVLGELARKLLPLRWECCLTCLLSDYDPAGVDLMGMRCHRGARSRYLAVRSKREYWSVPVTEEVPEFYRCTSYEPRMPGTGYRG
jgi:hypothetical protein